MNPGGWHKSSFSSLEGNCVEVLHDRQGMLVLVRDSKDRDGPILVFTGDEWVAFVNGVKDGEFG